jgi:hypothetical protein
VKCRGSFFEEQVQRGLAFVEDATFPYLPSDHPLRYQWLKTAQVIPQPALTLVGLAGGSQPNFHGSMLPHLSASGDPRSAVRHGVKVCAPG